MVKVSKGNIPLVIVTGISITCQHISDLYYFARISRIKSGLEFIKFTDSLISISRAMYATTAAAEILLALILVLLLRSSRVGYEKGDSVIDRLVLYTISSGGITAFNALAAMVAAFVSPKSFLHLVFGSLMVRSGLLLVKFVFAYCLADLSNHLLSVYERYAGVVSIHFVLFLKRYLQYPRLNSRNSVREKLDGDSKGPDIATRTMQMQFNQNPEHVSCNFIMQGLQYRHLYI